VGVVAAAASGTFVDVEHADGVRRESLERLTAGDRRRPVS
jgi:hypothetical protein